MRLLFQLGSKANLTDVRLHQALKSRQALRGDSGLASWFIAETQKTPADEIQACLNWPKTPKLLQPAGSLRGRIGTSSEISRATPSWILSTPEPMLQIRSWSRSTPSRTHSQRVIIITRFRIIVRIRVIILIMISIRIITVSLSSLFLNVSGMVRNSNLKIFKLWIYHFADKTSNSDNQHVSHIWYE